MSNTPPTKAGSFPSFSTVNFYAGSKLNRLSWLRTSTEFLNSTIASPETRFVVMKNNNPLCHADKSSTDTEGTLATLSWDKVKPYILENVKASGGVQTESDELLVFGPQAYALENGGTEDKDFTRATDGVGPNRLALVFLGIDESKLSESSLPGQMAKDASKDSDAANEKAPPAGVPYFALSLTYRPPFLDSNDASPMQALLEDIEAQKDRYDFINLRASSRASTWPASDAAIVAQAKSLLDWNERHQYCPGCSRQQYSLWAGYKRGCSSSLGHATSGTPFSKAFLPPNTASFSDDGKGVCPSTKVLSNFHYPRTDPVIIMAIISPDGEKVLLGRQKKWPSGFYSCLAGFCEPGESFEEAVRREVLEESGIHVDQVIYHSSQPWPYPTNLMAGFYGIAKTDNESDIRLDLDNELEDARFYTRKQILEVIESKSRGHFTKAELEKIDRDGEEKEVSEKQKEKVQIRLPPTTAIARVLVEAWAKGEAVLPTHMDNFQKTRM
ncbi:hypothetical protein PHSY_002637 [Pseudozyma hubeiensis SY62]|uniref:NAD(+) diphosphatase n=1 Tax=Pseudozyma hubeiensis (strain SY62) TaxID=1305764 RepID=R9P1N9_PSEHS|nr:hypothetical protein PHSY_002637 [Pseudozyma hubeiensis SY62]GAC95062.1 hypothetical protein PHSY_002637 [Pseudozyma hubeiensis SY62]